jgi:hypothetical protein
MVLTVMTPHSLVGEYQYFGGTHCIHHQTEMSKCGKVTSYVEVYRTAMSHEQQKHVTHFWTREVILTAMVWKQTQRDM